MNWLLELLRNPFLLTAIQTSDIDKPALTVELFSRSNDFNACHLHGLCVNKVLFRCFGNDWHGFNSNKAS